MISSGTFHVITTELVVGSFAMAGFCFLLKSLEIFDLLKSERMSQVVDYTGHFALGFGLAATPFAIFSGISSAPGSDFSSPLLVNKMFLSMTAVGLSLAVLLTRYRMGERVWVSKYNSLIQTSAGLAASGLMLITASAGGKFSRGESVLDIFNLPYDTIFLMPLWLSTFILIIGIVSTVLGIKGLKKSSSI